MLDRLLSDAYHCYGSGKSEEAARLCRQIVSQDPRRAEAIYLLAAIDQDAGRREAATDGFRLAVSLAPENAVLVNALGESLHNDGQFDAACTWYQKAITLRPAYERAHNNLGRILDQLGQFAAAEECFREAIRLNPNYATAHNNLGGVLLSRGRPLAAIDELRLALLNQLDYPEAHYNLAAALRATGDSLQAIPNLSEAIRLRPQYARAHHLLGQTLVDLGQMDKAVDCFESALRWQPGVAEAYRELGNVQMLLERFDEARIAFSRALEIDPQDRKTFAQICRLNAMVLDWTDLAPDQRRLWAEAIAEIDAGRISPIVPLFAFGLPWTGSQLLAVARSHARIFERNQTNRPLPAVLSTTVRQCSGRIKIGYLSRDFYDHAVGHQIQGVFAHHDRSTFEVHAYSFGPDDDSVYRRRIARDVEYFQDVTTLRDGDLANRIRADGIQILVDLMGYTGLARTSCVARRPAPIQVHWLGYPGTMGADFIDYLIGDAIVTPPDHADAYRECLVRLPNSYMPTDQSQPIAEIRSSRIQHGLPADPIVFCCFHGAYKITPEIFNVWMRILSQVTDSIAWLNVRHPTARQNLKQHARSAGIDPERLIFAAHVSDKSLHLERLQQADLFLDTPRYNAHVTACDALWAGLPVLTCIGNTFASRVGASLLTAANLTELIATNLHEYERRAVELGNNRTKLANLKCRMQSQQNTMALFDTPRFVRNLEKAYRTMWEIHASNRPAEPFDVIE